MTMTDREKVIEGLEVHLKPNSKCVGCPYPNNGLCVDSLLNDALKLLKAQEAKPPIVHTVLGVNYYYCPGCARPIIKSCADGHPRYCEDCGKGLKWE